jgi:hypothetical protein
MIRDWRFAELQLEFARRGPGKLERNSNTLFRRVNSRGRFNQSGA